MTARFNSIGDIWNNTTKTTIQTGNAISSDPKQTQINDLMYAFSKGEINVSTLKSRLANLGVTVSGSNYTATFNYNGKQYTINQTVGTYYKNTNFSETTLKNIYKLSDEQINKYFTKKGESEYTINPNSGYKSISNILQAVVQECRNNMVVANFLNDKNKKTNSMAYIMRGDDNKSFGIYSYEDYIDEINNKLGTDVESAKQKAIDKFMTDFAQGNVARTLVQTILKAIGVQYSLSSSGNNACVKFTYNNKNYQVYCNASASLLGTDNKTVTTYTADDITKTGASQELISKYFDSVATVDGQTQSYALKSGKTYAQFETELESSKQPTTFSYTELKNTYKFTDDIINKYFKKEETASARPQSGTSTNGTTYVLNTEAGCKTIDEVEQKMAEQYQKGMVLINFLNDKNRQTNNKDDMKKANDGNAITKDNYKNYVDEIRKTLGNDENAIVQKALDKFIKDFTEGNIALTNMGTVIDAMGLDRSKMKVVIRGQYEIGYKFEFNGKQYSMYCYAPALTSGTDKLTVETYATSDLQKSGATQEQIDKYFAEANSVDGEVKNYCLKPAYTYAQFEEEVKASQKKNGVETSKNAQGYKVETTYVDGVVTKVVEYQYDGKTPLKETEYFANGQVKHEAQYKNYSKLRTSETEYYENGQIKLATIYQEYSQDKESVTEYYENGQIKHEIKYKGKYVLSETEYYANGQAKQETKYKAYSDTLESETDFYENGKTKSETTYDYEKQPTRNEYDEKGAQLTSTKTYSDGSKSVTTYNADGSNVNTSYDKDGKPTKEVRTSSNGIVSYFGIEVADDGSKTVTEYSDKYMSNYNRVGVEKYDAQGRLTYKSKYSSTYSYTDTKYIYNDDGSRREISYGSHGDNTHGDITSDKTYDKNGRLIKTASYGSYSSKRHDIPDTEVSYTYDSNGAVATTTTTKYDIDYNNKTKAYYQDKKSETVTDKNGKVLSDTTYDSYKNSKVVTTNDGDKSTVSTYNANQLTREVVTDSANKTKTIITYKNGKKSNAIVQDLNGNRISEIIYNSNGEVLYEVKVTKNGNDTEETTTFADGRTAVRKNGAASAELKDKNGNLVGYIERHTAKVVTGTTIDEVRAGKNYDCLDIKNKNGEITSRVIYNSDGTVNYTQTYTYEYTDSKNYKVIIKDPNGDTHTEVYENGKKTKTYHWYQATRSTIVQEEGKGSAYSRVTGSVTMSGQTATAQDLYKAITDLNGRMWLYRNSTLIREMAGDITLQLLQMSQTSYNGTPSGCNKKMIGCNDVSAEYRETLKKIINNKVSEYGISADNIQGYSFPSTSTIAKTMAGDSDMKNFVKSNIKDLINGTNMPKTMQFNSNKDLSYAFHGVDVLSSKLSGTTLTLTVMDVYDFDGNKTGNSKSDVLNRAGNAAMKDGKLKPYYTLTEVKIDLTSLGFTAAQIQAMKS